MRGLYHLCFTVEDIDAAADELTRTLGVEWSPTRDGQLGEWTYRIRFSVAGPPFLELIEGSPGSPWATAGAPRFDHLGFWSADVDADKHALAARGAALDFDATEHGRPFTYHRLEHVGARVELVDTEAQADFLRAWAPQTAPMAALELADDGPSSAREPGA